MEFVTLNNGIMMPIVGYGVYQIPARQTKNCVLNAFEVGYRLIDTAQYYGNEAGVGQAIGESGLSRDEIFVTTKLMSNRHVAESIDESLRKLQSEYIDLLLIHWPMGNDLQTYRVMEDYVKKGKIRSIGLSNFYGSDYENIIKHCQILPAVCQQETHVLYQNKALQELYEKTGTYLEAWSPFGEGKEDIFNHPILMQIARKHQKTVAQVILRFLTQRGIIVIPKTSKRERMIENLSIFDFNLDIEDVRIIESLDRNRSLFNWY